MPRIPSRCLRGPGAGAVCQAHAASRGDTLVTVLPKDQRIRAILLISAAAWGGSTATITDARAGQEGAVIDLADAGPLAGRAGARKGFLFVQPCWSMGPPEEEKEKKRRKRREEEEDEEDELLALGIIYPWDDD